MRLISGMLLLATSAGLAPVVPGPEADPREDLDQLIPYTISLLESKQYAKVLETLIEPDRLQKELEEMNKSLEEVAAEFGEAEALRALEVLRQIRGKKPDLRENGTKAVYTLDQQVGTVKSFSFTKKNKLWRPSP
jgi:hypothetical protein